MDAVESLEVSLEANKEKAARARGEHETVVESLSGIVKERDAAAAKVREVLARQQENAQRGRPTRLATSGGRWSAPLPPTGSSSSARRRSSPTTLPT